MALPSPLPGGAFDPDHTGNASDGADITIADIAGSDPNDFIEPPQGRCWRILEIVAAGSATADVKIRTMSGEVRTFAGRAVGWSCPIQFNRLYKTGTTATVVAVYT